ncbi:5209_t:CDS:2, partial [Dentiscutata heterogama]
SNLTFEFYVEKKVGEKELSTFWVETRYNADNKYLSNKTSMINQNACLTTAVLHRQASLDILTVNLGVLPQGLQEEAAPSYLA